MIDDQSEGYFKALSALGPRIVGVSENQWKNVPYRITQRDSKYGPWHLRLAGLEFPKYDRYSDGPHNNAVRVVASHLVISRVDQLPGKPDFQVDFNGEEGRNRENTAQIPGCQIENSDQGHTLAHSSIDAYFTYQDRIALAIADIERVYRINSVTRTSQEFGIGKPDPEHDYPLGDDLRSYLIKLCDKYKLDFIDRKRVLASGG